MPTHPFKSLYQPFTQGRAPTVAQAVALVCAMALSQAASAITFERLAADGSGSGQFYTPTFTDWVLAPDAAETRLAGGGASWQIDVGTANFGSPESGSQTSGIFGAGLILPEAANGWRIDFSANLRTWDSYNDGSVVAPNPGASLGDWDLFTVNANHQDFYWNLVEANPGSGPVESDAPALLSTGLTTSAVTVPGHLIDPLVPTRPAGTTVQYTNTDQNPNYLPGSTWAWGGRDYAAGYFESVSTNGTVVVRNAAPTYVSFVLDSRTPPYNDTNLPSWGQFGAPGQFNDIPGGEQGGAPGGSFANPLLPVAIGDDGSFVFSPVVIDDGAPGLDAFLFIDPEVAVGYEYTLAGGLGFTEILLPVIGDADGYSIETLIDGVWTRVGTVVDGGTFTFSNAVQIFRVTGIDPALGLNPENSVAFTTGVKVNGPGLVQFGMTAITAEVPEPSTWAMAIGGLLLVGTRLTRRARFERSAGG